MWRQALVGSLAYARRACQTQGARVGVGQLIPRMEIEAVSENISDANVDVLVGRADI